MKGFGLIEIIVVVAIITVSLFGFLQAGIIALRLLRSEKENLETALLAKPLHDFIKFKAADERSSGQGIIFGTKPLEILIPYLKVLTKRSDLVVEPFGGSGSTLVASLKLNRRCFLMEKSPVYTEVILNRWEKTTGKKVNKIS